MDTQKQEYCAFKNENNNCTSVSSHYSDVRVPVNLKSYATVGDLVTQCCGEPTVSICPTKVGMCSCGCEIVITQTVCVRIPVEYGTVADVGKTTVRCKGNAGCGE